MYSLVI